MEVSSWASPPAYRLEVVWKGMTRGEEEENGQNTFAAILEQSGEVTFMYLKTDENIFRKVNIKSFSSNNNNFEKVYLRKNRMRKLLLVFATS